MENPAAPPHRAGFVSIVGKPNVGKSTLMNALVGEKLAIVTAKAQTTRHRIFGIISGEDFQIIYSDTPGIIEPKYELHRSMMRYVNTALEDADLILFVTDIHEKHDESDVVARLRQLDIPILLLINKIDLADEPTVKARMDAWQAALQPRAIVPISALHGFNTESVLDLIQEGLPEHPAYFPKDQLTDRPERFFAAEIIREKILQYYDQEIPYSCEVVVDEFREEDLMLRIRATILVERSSQKGILIGHKGESLKRVGTEARRDMEAFFGRKVFLEQHVKVDANWRHQKRRLDQLGYDR